MDPLPDLTRLLMMRRAELLQERQSDRPAVAAGVPEEGHMSDANKKAIRTAIQTGIGVAAALPMIVDASGIPAALPWVAGALAVAGGVARVMALPVVQALLPSWLRTGPGASQR